jgi:hypothetical protein
MNKQRWTARHERLHTTFGVCCDASSVGVEIGVRRPPASVLASSVSDAKPATTGSGANFKLSPGTISAIQAALASPGVSNANIYAAYTDIYKDIVANGGATAATQYWFSQAAQVNSQQFNTTAAGTYIWAYTEGAALAEGANVTTQQLQTASNRIAATVFRTLQTDNWTFNDTSSQSSEGIKTIIQDDAGSGLDYLRSQFPTVNSAPCSPA